MPNNQNSEFSQHFNEESFWDKVRRVASVAGKAVLKPALILYYCLKDEDTPRRDIAIILGALGYFIFPLDAIPDMIPGGYMDDLGVLLAAIRAITNSIKESHKEKAKRKCDEIFGSSNADESDTVAA